MQWNNLKDPQNKIFSEDGTLIATTVTPAIANYLCSLHNAKVKEREKHNDKRRVNNFQSYLKR